MEGRGEPVEDASKGCGLSGRADGAALPGTGSLQGAQVWEADRTLGFRRKSLASRLDSQEQMLER